MNYDVICLSGEHFKVYADSFEVTENNDIYFKQGDRVVGYVPRETYCGILVDISMALHWMAMDKSSKKKKTGE